jgi:hypothetical protein
MEPGLGTRSPGSKDLPNFGGIPDDAQRRSGLRRQDAEANIGEADGPKGEPQDAASNPFLLLTSKVKMDSGFCASRSPGMTRLWGLAFPR